MRYETTLGADLAATGAVTDIDILWTDTGPVLYATSRVSGTITAYDLSDGSVVDSQAVPGHVDDMGALEIALVDTGASTQAVVLSAGDSGLPSYAIGDTGTIGGQANLSAPGFYGTINASATIALNDITYFFAAPGSSGQVGTYEVQDDGTLTVLQKPTVPAGMPDDVSAMIALEEAGQGYLVLSSALEDSLQCYRINSDGSLKKMDTIGAADGLGINRPDVLATVTLDGQAFVLAGAAGSSSLSVVSLDKGMMTATDHVVDSLDTRFQTVNALATAVVGDRAYVVAAGGDDGLTLMSLLPTGRLVVLDTIADSLETGLDNVESLGLVADGGVLRIYAGSATEGGVTCLAWDLDAKSLTLTGTRGDDILTGGDGADILAGGQGYDQLRGGAGEDVFVFDFADDTADRILDFEAGIDRLDLSGWGMLRGPDQLDFTAMSNGIKLSFGAAALKVLSADGKALSEDDIREAMTPGSLIHAPVGTVVEGRTLVGTDGNDTLQGGSGDDMLQGLGGGDALIGGKGIDTAVYSESTGQLVVDLIKPEENKGVAAGDTYDSIENLIGSDGRDIFKGTAEDNYISGGNNMDSLIGRAGDDRLDGGADNDKLEGGPGADILIGGAGKDRAMYKRATEALTLDLADPSRNTGEAEGDTYVDIEEMVAGRADDLVWGDNAANRLWGREGNDQIRGRDGDDTILGGHGNDLIDGGAGNDILTGGGHHDSFVFGAGHDVITDFRPGIETIWLDAAALWSGTKSATKVVDSFAEVTEAGVVLDFGADASLTLEGVTSLDGLTDSILFL